MSWWTTVPALTPIAAWDALGFDSSGLVDRVGSNKLLWNNPEEAPPIYFRNVRGKGVVNYLQSTITLPAEYTLLVFMRNTARVVMFSRSNTTQSAVWQEDNGMYYTRNDSDVSSSVAGPVSYGSVKCIVLTRGSSAVGYYVDGSALSTSIPVANCPDYLGRILGWREESAPTYALTSSGEFYAAGVWAGAATLAELQALEAAVRSELALPSIGAFSAQLSATVSVNNPLALLPGPRPNVSAPLKAGGKNIYQGGAGTIQGTVTIENIPGARQVRLFDKRSGLVVAETWSSPTGHYEFNNVATDREYFVVAHDHLRVYNAVVQDMLTP